MIINFFLVPTYIIFTRMFPPNDINMDPNRSLSYTRRSNNFASASPAQVREVQVNVTKEVPKNWGWTLHFWFEGSCFFYIFHIEKSTFCMQAAVRAGQASPRFFKGFKEIFCGGYFTFLPGGSLLPMVHICHIKENKYLLARRKLWRPAWWPGAIISLIISTY